MRRGKAIVASSSHNLIHKLFSISLPLMWTQQQFVQPVPPLKLFHSFQPSNHAKIQSLSKLNSTQNLKTALTLEELPPNALRRKKDAEWRGGFSLGVDLGMARTGIALSKGFTFRPLTVLKLRGQKLEVRIMNIAEEEVWIFCHVRGLKFG